MLSGAPPGPQAAERPRGQGLIGELGVVCAVWIGFVILVVVLYSCAKRTQANFKRVEMHACILGCG
jgi:hypothetical protein